MPLRVLAIDDDRKLFELLANYFAGSSIELTHARTGRDGLRLLEESLFDAVLLDVMMPGLDGLDVLRRVREKSTLPVIMLTARGDEADRVVGLELGADDYVAKPFSPRELLARLRAVLRRARPDPGSERLGAGGVTLDPASRTAQLDGNPVELTGLEFDILLALVRRAGRVIPRSALLAEAGRSDVTVNDRTVDVHISRLRKKLGDDSRAPSRIRTVRGVGYVFSREPAT